MSTFLDGADDSLLEGREVPMDVAHERRDEVVEAAHAEALLEDADFDVARALEDDAMDIEFYGNYSLITGVVDRDDFPF